MIIEHSTKIGHYLNTQLDKDILFELEEGVGGWHSLDFFQQLNKVLQELVDKKDDPYNACDELRKRDWGHSDNKEFIIEMIYRKLKEDLLRISDTRMEVLTSYIEELLIETSDAYKRKLESVKIWEISHVRQKLRMIDSSSEKIEYLSELLHNYKTNGKSLLKSLYINEDLESFIERKTKYFNSVDAKQKSKDKHPRIFHGDSYELFEMCLKTLKEENKGKDKTLMIISSIYQVMKEEKGYIFDGVGVTEFCDWLNSNRIADLRRLKAKGGLTDLNLEKVRDLLVE